MNNLIDKIKDDKMDNYYNNPIIKKIIIIGKMIPWYFFEKLQSEFFNIHRYGAGYFTVASKKTIIIRILKAKR